MLHKEVYLQTEEFTIKAIKLNYNQKVTEQHSYQKQYRHQILLSNNNYIILALLSHGLRFAKSYAFIYSSVRTKTSITDEKTSFLQLIKLLQETKFLLVK